MRREAILIGICVLASTTARAAPEELTLKVVRGEVRMDRPLPADLIHPSGRTRWWLQGLEHRALTTVTTTSRATAVTVEERSPEGALLHRTVHSRPGDSEDALRWHFPQRFRGDLKPGARYVLEMDEEGDGGFRRLRLEIRNAGIGWVHLPSGPREAVLQRVLILGAAGRGAGLRPETVLHRWVDPRAGVVATVVHSASPEGRLQGGPTSASTVVSVLAGASTLTISVSELDEKPFSGLLYGFDRGPGTTVASLDPNGYATIGDLIAQDVWDFSGNTTGTEIAFTVVPVDANQTCNTGSCGYGDPNALLERNDIGFDNPDPNTWIKINTVTLKENRLDPNGNLMDVTIWLRAGSIKEGAVGTFGDGESRLCYESSGGVTRSEVPLWRFSNPGSTEMFMKPGDSWFGGPFNCEQNLFNQRCGVPQTFDELYSQACGTHTGTQTINVMKGGVVTLPSGHTFNALLVSNVADFCVYLTSGCSIFFKVDEVRTVNYLWQVPHLGSVVRLESEQNAPDTTSFTEVVETNISFGLFPPRTVSVTGVTDTTVSLSWDPGLITNRISAYKVYWDTDSGSGSSYAFNSEDDPNQASIAGTTATISGLTPGTDYFFTVTALSVYPPDPATPLPRKTYESLLYPTTVSGDPSFVYPAEVQATTTGGTCLPTAEVANVSVREDPAGIEICWGPVSDPCLTGYRILGSNTVDSDAGYVEVADLGVQTCWTGDPSQIYYIVTAKGTGGDGPWGHYGR